MFSIIGENKKNEEKKQDYLLPDSFIKSIYGYSHTINSAAKLMTIMTKS